MEATTSRNPNETTEEKLASQFKVWIAEIEQLKAKVDREVAEAKREYYEEVEALRRDVEAQLLKWSYELKDAKAEAAKPDIRQAVRDLRAKLDEELKAWEPKIEALKSGAAQAEAEAKRMVEELRGKRDALKKDLSELKGASEAAWGDVRSGVGKAWDELRTALKSASEKFK